MATKTFKDFPQRTNLQPGDWLVGYNAESTREIRTRLEDVISALSAVFIPIGHLPTPTPTITVVRGLTQSPTPTITITPIGTLTVTPTQSITNTNTSTSTPTVTPTVSLPNAVCAVITLTPALFVAQTSSPTQTYEAVLRPTVSPTATSNSTPTPSVSITNTPSQTNTPTQTTSNYPDCFEKYCIPWTWTDRKAINSAGIVVTWQNTKTSGTYDKIWGFEPCVINGVSIIPPLTANTYSPLLNNIVADCVDSYCIPWSWGDRRSTVNTGGLTMRWGNTRAGSRYAKKWAYQGGCVIKGITATPRIRFTPTQTITPFYTPTPTNTNTSTSTPTITPTITNTYTPTGKCFGKYCVDWVWYKNASTTTQGLTATWNSLKSTGTYPKQWTLDNNCAFNGVTQTPTQTITPAAPQPAPQRTPTQTATPTLFTPTPTITPEPERVEGTPTPSVTQSATPTSTLTFTADPTARPATPTPTRTNTPTVTITTPSPTCTIQQRVYAPGWAGIIPTYSAFPIPPQCKIVAFETSTATWTPTRTFTPTLTITPTPTPTQTPYIEIVKIQDANVNVAAIQNDSTLMQLISTAPIWTPTPTATAIGAEDVTWTPTATVINGITQTPTHTNTLGGDQS